MTLEEFITSNLSELIKSKYLRKTFKIDNDELEVDLYYVEGTVTSAVFKGCTAVDAPMQILVGQKISVFSGITLIPPYRCKGLVIYAMNSLVIDGEVSMSARGAKGKGLNIPLCEVAGVIQSIPAEGAAGGIARRATSNGTWWNVQPRDNGVAGQDRQTGGGGAGRSASWHSSSLSGAGSAGTSFSGGSGGGGASGGSAWSTAQDAAVEGGPGGNAQVNRWHNGDSWKHSGGGVGNPGGYHSYSTGGGRWGWSNGQAPSGTGGLLIIYAFNANIKKLSARGVNTISIGYDHSTSGGASGGGSVNVFANSLNSNIVVDVSGGSSPGDTANCYTGGAGGKGSYTYNKYVLKLGRYLIKKDNEVLLEV